MSAKFRAGLSIQRGLNWTRVRGARPSEHWPLVGVSRCARRQVPGVNPVDRLASPDKVSPVLKTVGQPSELVL